VVVPLLVIGAVVLGATLRLLMFTGKVGEINADEAVIGLMARAVLHGDIAVFYWGQTYGGSLETLLLAPIVAVFDGRLALQILPAIESVAVVALTFAVARRILDRQGALLAAALAWIYPLSAVYFSTRQMLFYLPITIFGLAMMWAALVLAEDRHRSRWWFGAGLAAGLGWWCSPQILLFALPVAAWLLARLRAGVLAGWPALLGGVVGASPWLVYHGLHPDTPFVAQPVGGEGTYVDHLRLFGTEGLPLVLGLRHMMSLQWVIPGGRVALVLVALIVLAAFLRPVARRSIHLWVLAAYPFLLSLSPSASYVGNGRYLFFLAPVLAITLMHGAGHLVPRSVVLVAGAALTLTASGVVLTWPYPRFSNAAPTGDLQRAMAAMDVDRAVSGYWVTYKLMYDSDQEILVAPLGSDRSPEITSTVLSSSRIAYVYATIFDGWEQHVAEAQEALASRGIESTVAEVPGYALLVPRETVRPSDLPGNALPPS
jgi:hypothetical protein